jgi:hypothetical protein
VAVPVTAAVKQKTKQQTQNPENVDHKRRLSVTKPDIRLNHTGSSSAQV